MEAQGKQLCKNSVWGAAWEGKDTQGIYDKPRPQTSGHPSNNFNTTSIVDSPEEAVTESGCFSNPG